MAALDKFVLATLTLSLICVSEGWLIPSADQSVGVGSDVQLEWLDNDAANVFAYYWYFKATSATAPKKILTWKFGTVNNTGVLPNVVYVSNSTIALTSVTTANAGTYSCIGEYVYCPRENSHDDVIVTVKKGTLNSPADQHVAKGSDVRIGWVDDNAANVLSYTWSFKAEYASSFQNILTWTSGSITNTNVLSNVAYVSDATILLTTVTSETAGTYRCKAEYNPEQTPIPSFDDVIMTVTKGPLNSPADQHATTHSDVKIKWVDGNAANVLSYTWSFKAASAFTFQNILTWAAGTAIETGVLSNVAYVSDATISLTSVTAANAGTYRCNVAYTIGQTPTFEFDEVVITVAKDPLNSPPDKSVSPSTDVRIAWVDDNAANVVSYTWSFNAASASTFQSILISASGTLFDTNVLSNVVHESGAAISLRSITPANAGTYKCYVVYAIGQTPAFGFDEVIITVANTSDKDESGNEVAIAVGVSVAVMAILIMSGLGVYFAYKWRRRNTADVTHTSESRPNSRPTNRIQDAVSRLLDRSIVSWNTLWAKFRQDGDQDHPYENNTSFTIP